MFCAQATTEIVSDSATGKVALLCTIYHNYYGIFHLRVITAHISFSS